MLQSVYRGHCTVPAVSTQEGTYDIIWVTCMAAEEFRSPVMLTHYVNIGAYSGHDWLYKTAKWMAARVSVPVAIHLDHGNSFERCIETLKLGFTSIMSDGSIPLVGENAAATKAVARVCRSFGVPLGAGIGELYRPDDKGSKMGASNITDPDVVKQYLKLCHPDSLATGIGNTYGFHSGPVGIRAKVLEECRKFTDILFIPHGYTGMDEELVKRSIDGGTAKISFGIRMRCQYMDYLKEGLAESRDWGHTWRLSQYAELRLCEGIKDIVRLAGFQEKA